MSWRDHLWHWLGRDPVAAVVHFASGPEERVRAMYEEIRALEPHREHFVVTVGEPAPFGRPLVLEAPTRRELRRRLGRTRIGLAPFLLGGHPLAALARRAAPRRLLAFNERGERHHLRADLSSLLFTRGVPLDRIGLRPAWWPGARERSRASAAAITLEGRPLGPRPRMAILSPYFPWPLAHGGAVRIYSLLREAAKDFDLYLYCFAEPGSERDAAPVLDLVHQAVLFEMPRYREPRWASLLPPEVREYESPALRARLRAERDRWSHLQVEYTYLADYPGDVLVEHDVTFDLYAQIHAREHTLSSWWNLWRWRRFEQRAVRRYPRIVAMAEKDAALLPSTAPVRVLPNGVDLARFTPVPEPPAARLLFIGSFRHFPNITAFRFFFDEVWPLVRAAAPTAHLTVIAGPEPELYWKHVTPAPLPVSDSRFTLHGFVRDVKPFYDETNLVLAPTLVSAGTNLKVLEAMAMERAVVATSSGCAGLRLEHGRSVWIADEPAAMAEGILRLLADPGLRGDLARAARRVAVDHFSWEAIGAEQRRLWEELG